jgi:hypothetical protein
MVIKIEGGPKRPRMSAAEKGLLRDYLLYKRFQCEKAVATLRASEEIDPTKFSKKSLEHYLRQMGHIDWLVHGLGATAVR